MIEYDAISESAWTRLEHAAQDPADPFRLAAFATTSDENAPTLRILVLRGADRQDASLWFHCDAASSKVAHIRKRPHVAVLFYDAERQVQMRVRGFAVAHVNDQTTQDHWEHIQITSSRYASDLFLKSADAQPDPRMHSFGSPDRNKMRSAKQENLAVIHVRVDEIDWLQIKGERQRRALLRASSGWNYEPLNP